MTTLKLCSLRIALPLLLAVGGVVAAAWARKPGPFTQLDFSLPTPDAGRTRGTVVMPKPAARFPVVVYLGDAGGNLMAGGQALRQAAELGCAAVALEYDRQSQLGFNEQLLALHQYLKQQRWARSNAVAWVGIGLGAQRSLSCLLSHPAIQPQRYVRVGGGLVAELKPSADLSLANRRPALVTCPVLLVHGERDEVFPAPDCQSVAAALATNGVEVETRILPGLPHGFGEEAGVVMREYNKQIIVQAKLFGYAARQQKWNVLWGCGFLQMCSLVSLRKAPHPITKPARFALAGFV